MPKPKRSKKQEFCFADMPALGRDKRFKSYVHDSKKPFRDKKAVALALFQCLEDNDPESFVEILETYLEVNKTEIAKKANLSRSTVQNAFSNKGNPTIRTIAQIVHKAVA
ncbi:MAG: helix-turn-helix domain-containing protein [Candidatus Algichlamydia australiensis]|nr:helix-turn-helix domain-containing protein [Chlamydiales bacterium]